MGERVKLTEAERMRGKKVPTQRVITLNLAEAVQINLTWKGVIAIRERKVTWVYFPEELTI